MACATNPGGRKRVMPPTYFLAALVLAIATRYLLPRWALSNALTIGAGIALLSAGVVLNLASDSAFKRRNTPVSPDAEPAALVASGVFRVTRNPMYLGMVLIVAAAALLIGAPVGLVFAIGLMWALNRFFVPREENRLAGVFGNQYEEFRASVPRWI